MSTYPDLEKRIASLGTWHYQFDLDGHHTPVGNAESVVRHEERKRYFFHPLVQLMGGSLAGKRVLDLGCNAGFWSLLAVEHGCDYVLGIDGRQKHVDQAQLVFEVKGVDRSRYDFRCANVYEALREGVGRFDVVLCLGLLYHLNKHVELFELVSAVNDDLLVVDTKLSVRRGSFLQLRHECTETARNSVDYSLVMHPTRDALRDMVQQFGYRTVILPAEFSDYSASEDYLDGSRRAMICAKATDLSSLPVEPPFTRPRAPKPTAPPAPPKRREELSEVPAGKLLEALGKRLLKVGRKH